MTIKSIQNLIAASTHPKEYLLHKYWSRKPSNIIAHFLAATCSKDYVLVDPFCGSGVSLLEAKRLGLTAYGFDINPIAATLSRVTINPPSVEEFSEYLQPILSEFRAMCLTAFSSDDANRCVKYNVHEIVVKCSECSRDISYGDAIHTGRIKNCPHCEQKLHFNLRNLVDTRVVRAILEPGEITDKSEISKQTSSSTKIFYKSNNKYDYPFIKNRRILAFEGMSTRTLFTKRNFSLLSWFADQCHAIPDESIRDTACLLLTASVAQCSRLTAYRNNMTTGGPAWSVPGFWVPPVHLETNPIFHLQARYKKFIRGLTALHKERGHGKAHVECMSYSAGVLKLKKNGVYADVIFFDPPYGDSVPFTEFSQLWNSFLKKIPDVDQDLSVSDRHSNEFAWLQYEKGLHECVSELSYILKPEGLMLVTFNNSDVRAWQALLGAFQKSKYLCNFVGYQIPAVISAKAQFSVEGSYISDVYSIWKKGSADHTYGRGLGPIIDALTRVASSRGGVITKSLARRVFMLSMLENNCNYECLKDMESVFESIFNGDELWMRLKVHKNVDVPEFRQLVRSAAISILSRGAVSWQRVYEVVARSAQAEKIGIPDPNEVKSALADIVLINKDKCLLLQDKEKAQRELFAEV